jgi:hypothetical protein
MKDQRGMSVEILLGEYQSLRNEIHATMQNRNQILSFGLALMGVLVASPFVAGNPSAKMVTATISLAIPAVAALVLHLWLAEYVRMVRAGRHLVSLELKINSIMNASLLTWETGRFAKGRPASERNIDSTCALRLAFLFFAIGAPFFGAWVAGASHWYFIVPWSVIPMVASWIHVDRYLLLVGRQDHWSRVSQAILFPTRLVLRTVTSRKASAPLPAAHASGASLTNLRGVRA